MEGMIGPWEETRRDIDFHTGKPHMAQIGDRVLDPQVDFCFSEEPVPKVPEVPPKRWSVEKWQMPVKR